jgi:Zn-dependent M28 family amino/carboxypeptidase
MMRTLCCALAVVAAGCGAVTTEGAERRSRERLSADLQRAVTPQGLRTHLTALERIADANGGHRAAATTGFAASVRYVRDLLVRAGYRVRVASFPYVRFVEELERARQLTPVERPLAVEAFEYSPSTPSGGVRGSVVAAGDGCQASDFDNLTGKIALVRRGTCFFAVKSRNAAQAGALAAIIFNNESGPLDGTLGGPGAIPTVAVSRAAGESLAREGVSVALEVRARTVRTTAQNVVADNPSPRKRQVLVAGAHLDSVQAGAGINDNGTGVAALLEIARTLQRLDPDHSVRFGFWGAEESGLWGSRAFVREPRRANLIGVVGYLNFDMLGARTFVRGVYRGPFAQTFERHFARRGLRSQTIDLGGRSDHAPFADAGVPVGGLFSGTDPCYHRRCDRLANVNERGLHELADAAAHGIALLAPR